MSSSISSNYDILKEWIPYYHGFLYLNCALITILYPLCVYMPFFSGVKINFAYKLMFFGCSTTSLLNALLQAFWAPIFTPTFFGGIITGILGRKFGVDANLKLFQLSLIILTNSQLCTVSLLVFQFSNLQPNSFLAKFGQTPKRLVASHTCYLTILILIAIIIVPYAINEPNQFQTYTFSTNNTFAKEIISHNEIYLTFVARVNPASYALVTLILISTLFLFFFGFYYTIILTKVISKTREFVSEQTYKLEKMMLRTFIFKTIMMLIFYCIPLIGYCVYIWTNMESPAMAICFNIFIVSHGWISYIGSFVFIGPYRRKIIKFILYPFGRGEISSSSSSVRPTTDERHQRKSDNNKYTIETIPSN